MKRALLAIGVLAALLAGAGAAAGAPAPPADSTAQYAADVRAAALSLEAAARGRARSTPAVHVPPAPLPGPPRYSPSLDDWLQATLRTAREQKRPKPRAQILREAAATLRSAVAAAHATPVTPARAIGPTVAAILANPAYHQVESGTEAQPHKSLWQRFLEWLADMFAKLFQGISNAANGVPLLGQILAALTVAAIAALVLLMGYRLARYFVAARRRTRASDDAGELLKAGDRPEALYARARDAASAGRYAAAVALVFRAGLLQLDAGGVIPYDAARTAGEYRRAVRRERAPAAAPFDELARSFTLAAYAEAPVGEHEWRGADAAYLAFAPRVAPAHETAASL
jgi:hypothetical protein